MKRKEIFLVILLIGFGLMYELFDSGENGFFRGCSFNSRGLLEKTFIPFDADESRFAGVQRLEIVNKAGSIAIKPSGNGETLVRPQVRVYHKIRDRAEKIRKEIQISVKEANGVLYIQTGAAGDFPYQRVRIHVEVELPMGVEIKLQNRYGDILVAGSGMEADIESKYGDIDVSNLSKLKLRHGYGDIVVKNIAGLADIQTRYGKTSVSNARSVELKCHHTRVIVADIQDGLRLENSHETVRGSFIRGDVSIDARHCRIDLEQIDAQQLVISNSYKDVRLAGISAESANLLLSHGNLFFDFVRIGQSISIKSTYADIVLGVPPAIDPLFHIKTTYGNIKNDTSLELDVLSGKIKTTVTSGGETPSIVIDNTYGDVYLKNAKPVERKTAPLAEAPEIKI